MHKYFFPVVLPVILCLHLAAAQPAAGSVPSPQQVIGYALGERFTSYARIENYLFAVRDAAPERMKLVPYGTTYEGRTLYLAILSSPENLAALESISGRLRRLADPRVTSDAAAAEIVKSTPAIVWLSYGVHGNEASSPEAALEVLYQLASRTDAGMNAMLKHTVVIVDPLLNPDGHERYVNFQAIRSGRKPVEEKAGAEHNEDWPSGRTNHYLFDLNRDWAWLTQQESRARIAAYQQWKPQVHVDFHEMGYNSSYFFFPAFKPVNKNLPKSTSAWGEIYGKANAAAFDERGWVYWSGESFDLFYPGYGDSWPSLNGAIGMTYEQAGQVGVSVRRLDETILTLKDRIDHHVVSSLATVKATADHREERLRDFRLFFKDAMEEGRTGAVKAFIVPPGSDPARTAKMIGLLRQQGIEVARTAQEISVKDAATYFVKETQQKKFPAGTYVISLAQPAKRLVLALMEQEPAFTDTFFYDLSTWALPVAYGVETYWTGMLPSAQLASTDTIDPPAGKIVGEKATYAYVFPWRSNDAARALIHLLQEEYMARVAMKEFTLHGTAFDRGAIIVPVHGNRPELHEKIAELSRTYHIDFYTAQSGYTESGINLGSDRAVRLKKPKIIVVTNAPVGTEAFGAIWSMFDQQYGIDFVPMKLAQLRSTDLHDYTAIVFPDDNAGGSGYRSQLDSNAVQRLKTWIAAGGTFIGIEGGAVFASGSSGKIVSVKLKEKKKEEKKEEKKGDEKKEEKLSEEELEKRMTVEERERKSRLEQVPGTIMRVTLDNSHPLGFGYSRELAVLKTTRTMFELSGNGYNVGMYAKSPRLSGYISPENEKLLAETPFLIHEKLGAGNVVLFADDPNFRLFWDGLNRLFLNSLLFMPSIRYVGLAAEGAE